MRNFAFHVIPLFFLIKLEHVESNQFLKHGVNYIIRKIDSVIDDTISNTQCGTDLKTLMRDLVKTKRWALQMIDASAKIESGLLMGNANQMGNYDQCLEISERNENYTISGQYCTFIIRPKFTSDLSAVKPKGFTDPLLYFSLLSGKANRFLKKFLYFLKMSYGICVPSSCSVENLRSIWAYFDKNLSPLVNLTIDDTLCDFKGKPAFKMRFEAVIFFLFGLYFSVLISATIYEIYYFDGNEDSLNSFICTLSLKRNALKLFSTQCGEDNISCINGLKVLSMMWVVIGHRFLANALLPNTNAIYLIEWKDSLRSMPIVGSTVSVDTFLAISGVLVSYIYLRYSSLKGFKISTVSFYILRVMRLAPTLLAVILIYISVLKHVNDGPMWPMLTAKLARDCVFHGWTNLLFINNFLNLTSQCVPQSWYLSVDSQLYFTFPLIFFTIVENPRRTLLGMLTLGIISSLTAFLVTMRYGYGSILDMSYIDNMYQSSFYRMPVWLIGVATGHLIFQYKDKKLIIPRKFSLIIWPVAFLLLNLILFGQVSSMRNENNPIYSAFFNAFGRPLWALTICWIIFACASGNGGCLNTFLSLPVFNFLAKLTYSLFLVHIMVIAVISGRNRTSNHFSNMKSVHDFFGDAAFSIAVAAVFSLLFESPVITFSKKVFRRYEEIMESNDGETDVSFFFQFFPEKIEAQKKTD